MENGNPLPVLEREYPLLLNDIGPDAALRSWQYFDFLQDIAARHAEILGVGMSHLRDLGIIWVLSRMHLKIEDHPLFGDSLRIRTWPSGFRKLFATRQYEVRSGANGRLLASGSSFWLTLDASSLRPVPPARMVNGFLPDNPDKPFFFENPGKIAPAECPEPVAHTAWQSVIDYNDHLNNAIYVRYIQDFLASERGAPVRLREIRINYNHAVKFGEVLLCGGTLSPDGSSFRVSGSLRSGANVFCAEGSIF